MKKLLILFYILFACEMAGFTAPDSTLLVPVTVNGIVLDSLTGTGVPNHRVYFLTDSFSTVNIYDSAQTNASGYYDITVLVPSNTIYLLQVYTYDCMNVMHDSIVGSPYYSFVVNFTICDSVSYPMFNLGGQVFGGFFPQSIGQVVLYKTTALEYLALDTATLNLNGVYYFYQIPAGDYVVKAFSPENPGIGQRYFPSYSPQGILWQNAASVHLSQNLFNADITLTAVQNIASGAGNVAGDVSLTTATSPVPLANVEVLLLDSLMQPLDYTITDPDGHYIFYGIRPGVHFLRPEIPGKVCEPISFQAIGSFPDTTVVNILVPGNVIGIDEPGLIYSASEVFPNPAHLGSSIELAMLSPSHGDLRIFDITGRIIKQSTLSLGRGSNTLTLPLENLRNGMYILNIQLNGCKPLNRKFLLNNN